MPAVCEPVSTAPKQTHESGLSMRADEILKYSGSTIGTIALGGAVGALVGVTFIGAALGGAAGVLLAKLDRQHSTSSE